jgi:hypothetical protein
LIFKKLETKLKGQTTLLKNLPTGESGDPRLESDAKFRRIANGDEDDVDEASRRGDEKNPTLEGLSDDDDPSRLGVDFGEEKNPTLEGLSDDVDDVSRFGVDLGEEKNPADEESECLSDIMALKMIKLDKVALNNRLFFQSKFYGIAIN